MQKQNDETTSASQKLEMVRKFYIDLREADVEDVPGNKIKALAEHLEYKKQFIKLSEEIQKVHQTLLSRCKARLRSEILNSRTVPIDLNCLKENHFRQYFLQQKKIEAEKQALEADQDNDKRLSGNSSVSFSESGSELSETRSRRQFMQRKQTQAENQVIKAKKDLIENIDPRWLDCSSSNESPSESDSELSEKSTHSIPDKQKSVQHKQSSGLKTVVLEILDTEELCQKIKFDFVESSQESFISDEILKNQLQMEFEQEDFEVGLTVLLAEKDKIQFKFKLSRNGISTLGSLFFSQNGLVLCKGSKGDYVVSRKQKQAL